MASSAPTGLQLRDLPHPHPVTGHRPGSSTMGHSGGSRPVRPRRAAFADDLLTMIMFSVIRGNARSFGVGDRTGTLLKVATDRGLERSPHPLGSSFRYYDP